MKEKQTSVPVEFVSQMQNLLGSEWIGFLDALQTRTELGLRVNPLKITAERLIELVPFRLQRMLIPDGFRVDSEENPGKHPFHAAGLYYLQDPAAIVAAWLLDPQPGERVLDLSAAPGGKATHLAALMKNQGLLVANEIDRQRARDLVENIERMGVRNAVVTNEHPDRLVEVFSEYFDRVMVDAPCSGEGMFAKSDAARAQWSPAFVQSCAVRQKHIIRSAAKMVRPGGRLAYVTCAFSPEEDEWVVANFLRDHPEFRIVDVPKLEGFAPGRKDWLAPDEQVKGIEYAVRLWPHLWPGGGHFITIMERKGDGIGAELYELKSPRFWEGTEQAIAAFAADTWTRWPEFGELALFGDELCVLPEEKPDLRNLSIRRYGLKMGEILKGRLEPEHALVMGVAKELCRKTVDLRSDSPVLQAYMRGEPFQSAGEGGWVVVCVEGYPLGWGKRVGDVVKNHYPRGLRRG